MPVESAQAYDETPPTFVSTSCQCPTYDGTHKMHVKSCISRSEITIPSPLAGKHKWKEYRANLAKKGLL